ncbi:acyl-CoA N-acyltransferase [Phellopilus nigrolimitatus]|nr:acyl-CoA N-acyltransferase [Phellopilus nigrolimitatus]
MGPPNHKDDAILGPAPVTPGGTYPIETISVGCKVYIKRKDSDGEIEERLAEILSIRDKPVNTYTKHTKADQYADQPGANLEFFVHWDQFNKRLDEWVSGARIVLSRDLEWPRPKLPAPKKAGAPAKIPPGKLPKKRTKSQQPLFADESVAHSPSPAAPSPAPSGNLKRKTPHDEESNAEGDDENDADAEGEEDIEDIDLANPPPINPPKPLSAFSKEQEIEKLRHSGSMTQSISEIARVKNMNRLQIGKYEVEAWYFSPYPREYAYLDVLYICEFCLSYFPSPFMLKRHRNRCTLLHPPGNEIYRHEDISFWEIDGRKQLHYCRNLSLLSKCFLDHKTLYYDVTPFLYYVMTQKDSSGCHFIGYFSKEKESAENYNVACILTLPQHQRHGFGRLQIEFSYELSKKEGKLGSPEKPLSDLGLLGYRAYWAGTIVELLLSTQDELSIDDIAQKTAITHTDVMNTCTTLQLFKHYKGQHVICLSDTVLEQYEKARAKRRRRIAPECLIWKPPVFTRDQLRFGW